MENKKMNENEINDVKLKLIEAIINQSDYNKLIDVSDVTDEF